MGPIEEHLRYVSDRVRLDAYRDAIRSAVGDGCVVADLGCGTGVLGLMCLAAGAGVVREIDSSPMLEVARATFARAGLSDRASFHAAFSTHVELPGPVDIVVCDQVGHFGFDAGLIQYFVDARRRFLKPGGTLIPSRLRICAAGVESATSFEPVRRWHADAVPRELRWVRDLAVNTKYAVRVVPDEILTLGATLGEVDLYGDNSAPFTWHGQLRTRRAGILHGLVGWFECQLADRIWMTNAPLAEARIDRPQAFLPVAESVKLRKGEPIAVTVVATPGDDMLAWVVELESGRRFKHSTWLGMPLANEALRRGDPARRPRLNKVGFARATVLSYCDGSLTSKEIQAAVLRDHPQLLPAASEIERFVARVLARDTDG